VVRFTELDPEAMSAEARPATPPPRARRVGVEEGDGAAAVESVHCANAVERPGRARAAAARGAPDDRAFDYYPCLGRVREHVVRHLGEEITLSTAASVAGLEYHHFSRFFHERVGVCFRDWLSALRVARAMEMLAQREQPISRVGDAVGFADRRTLQRSFKRWLGMTPRQYRARVAPRARPR
jgi:AraC-like DNA-binding protein